MRSLSIFLAVCILGAYCYDVRDQFDEYIAKYNKPYKNNPGEYEARLQNFEDSLIRIKEMETRSPFAKFGINKFSDMSENEFRTQMLNPQVSAQELARSCLAHGVIAPPELDVSNLPTSFDWRTKGIVNPVKNQEDCGSCWAFSTISVIESQWALKGNNLTSFSEQLLVDCSTSCSNDDNYVVCNQGCDGGWQWNAYQDIMSWQGVETESEYPYTGEDGTCQRNPKLAVAPIKNYTCLSGPEPFNETQMAAYLISYGPIAIAMNASMLNGYSGGIYYPAGDCDGTVLDHAVVVVGYGEQYVDWWEGTVKYWIIRNSWGADWGEAGYFRLLRGTGACGMNNAVSSVVM